MPFWSLEELRNDYARIEGSFEGAIPFVMLLDPAGKVLYQKTEAKDYQELQVILNKITTTDQ